MKNQNSCNGEYATHYACDCFRKEMSDQLELLQNLVQKLTEAVQYMDKNPANTYMLIINLKSLLSRYEEFKEKTK